MIAAAAGCRNISHREENIAGTRPREWRFRLYYAISGRFYGTPRDREVQPMKCPFCAAENDRVTDSRACQDGFVIRRRRHCLSCERRYTTYERYEEVAIKVVKKGGVREPFQREKLRQGLARACWKRPISDEHIDSIVAVIESQVYSIYDTEVTSLQLGAMAMEQLGDLDQVAYVRFASVYREFKDVRDFVQELQPILRQRQIDNGEI
jgi:transcriptional repressor NrdR